jgi:hypothetical protein
VRIINIITRISLGAFRQESATQSATNHICGTLEFYKGRIEIVDKNRIRIYFHKHHDILDVADEYYRTDGFNNLSKIMKKILKTPDNK